MSTVRRRYLRPEALNLLDYLVVDAQGRQGEYSMARTLNVTTGGILMVPPSPLPTARSPARQRRAQGRRWEPA